jgi:hypothetical protein
MPRTQSKAKKLIIAGCVAAGAAAIGVGTTLSASAASAVTGHGTNHNSAYFDAVGQCGAAGSQSGYETSSQQQSDGSWIVRMVCR